MLYDVKSRKILLSRSVDRQIPPASLTKILSIFVAEDAIKSRKLNRNAPVTVSARAAAAGGSRMGLSRGDRVPLDTLLRGMAVSSGNDASIAVAEYIGGTEQKFVRMMNKKARSLGMTRSTFKNANGLPAWGQYTTAKDMLALARGYLAAYPGNLQKFHNQSFATYNGKFTCNANPMLGAFPGADGLKTGYVNASGYNLIATAQRGGQRVIGVILGAPSSAVRASQARTLMEACFSNPSMFTAQTSDPSPSLSDQNQPSSSETTAKAAPKSGKGKKNSGITQSNTRPTRAKRAQANTAS